MPRDRWGSLRAQGSDSSGVLQWDVNRGPVLHEGIRGLMTGTGDEKGES